MALAVGNSEIMIVTRIGAIELCLIDSPRCIESEWRAFERTAVATAFQSFDWVDAWCELGERVSGEKPIIVVGRTAGGALAFIWPMAIAKWRGMSVLTWLAQNQNWYNMGLWRADVVFGLDAGDLDDLLDELVVSLPEIQAIHLLAQPKSWDGFPNPFALVDHTVSPVRTYAFACGPCSAGHAKLTGGRAHFNKKVRRLAKLGAVAFEMVEDEAGRISAIDRFFDWKAERLAALGLRNGFSCPSMRAFHRELARRSGSGGALRVEALRVESELVSVALSLRFRGRQYYLNSAFDSSPSNLQYSPGLLIAENMFAQSVNDNVLTIDYGPGESPEKMKWGVAPTDLFETYRSISARGWVPTMRRRLSSQVLHFIRRTPELHALLRQISRGLRRFNSVGEKGI